MGVTNWLASAATIAAPVGVTISASPSPSRTGIPFNNSTVAGPGTGRIPWREGTTPFPIGSGDV